jgi:hypothetical protein
MQIAGSDVSSAGLYQAVLCASSDCESKDFTFAQDSRLRLSFLVHNPAQKRSCVQPAMRSTRQHSCSTIPYL